MFSSSKIIVKSALFLSLVLFFSLLTSQITFAQQERVVPQSLKTTEQSKCIVNGQEVPCEQVTEQIKSFFGWGIGLIVVTAIIGLVATIFWIVMLVHAATHEVTHKAMWIILMVFTGFIGALIYYFVVKRKFDKDIKISSQTPTGV